MLQRAANHAYSWWWASHIRTKQSKWLEQSLQDMEEKVQGMVLLIEGDGDSFAKRAEMYYRRRPELICAVEEAYKVFRALADRYDLLSKDLQNANHTIATVFPEQVQFSCSMADDDDIPKIPDNFQIPEMNLAKIPQVPTPPPKDLKTIMSTASKQFQASKLKSKTIVKSGLSKEEALDEINKLQKDILSLQTMKEFVKSSYESGIAKYWSIETQVMDMQQKISRLQDEFNMETVIEDEEARTLMAEAALKSCEETLAMLQEKQEKTNREAQDEYKRIEAACDRLQSLRDKYMLEHPGILQVGDGEHKLSKDVADLIQETKEIEELPEKSDQHLDVSSLASLSVTQLAEKIDQLVNKVFTLETAVSSQTVLVNTLRSETDSLNSQIQNLENENDNNFNDDSQVLSTKVKTMEEKLSKVQDLTKNVEIRSNTIKTNFAKTRTSIDHIAGKLTNIKEDDDDDDHDHVPDSTKLTSDHISEDLSSAKEDREKEESKNLDHASRKLTSGKIDEEVDAGTDIDHASERLSNNDTYEDKQDMHGLEDSDSNLIATKTEGEEIDEDVKEVKKVTRRVNRGTEEEVLEDESEDAVETKSKAKSKEQENEDDDISWQMILLSGMEDREKILLKEYTTILRNYKEVKKKLNDVEKKERDAQFDITIQMRELKKAISRRDEEIMKLRRLIPRDGDIDLKEDSIQLSSFQQDEDIQSETNEVQSLTRDIKGPPITDENEGVVFVSKSSPSRSRVEEKLRMEIDAILNENLDFWFRFSSAFHQIQKFKTEVGDLEDEVKKLREKGKLGGSQIKSEVMPIYKHLTEIQRGLTIWLEQSVPLKNELKKRFSSLCNIQEEITKALKEGEENKFSSHQAAKLQGEVLNMKQENDKVRGELEGGLNHVSMLQLQIEKTLAQLNEEFGISSDQSEHRHRVPLRSFIFGWTNKSKKPKTSIFPSMHPSKKYQILRAGIRHSSHTNNNTS